MYIELKDWFKNIRASIILWSHTKSSNWAMFFCALLDACCLPLPTPIFFISLVLLNKNNAYRYALYATIGAFLGAIIGYTIGYFLWLNINGEFSKIALFVFEYIPGFTVETYNLIRLQFDKWNYWILAIASFLPIPYKIFSISSGVFHINFIVFALTTLVSKMITFYGFAFLTIKIGKKIKSFFHVKFKFLILLIIAFITIAIVVVKNL